MNQKLKIFLILLDISLGLPIVSRFLHYQHILPNLTRGCYMTPHPFDSLINTLHLIIFGVSLVILITGVVKYFKNNKVEKNFAKQLLFCGIAGLLGTSLSIYIFGNYITEWYGSLSIPCLF